MTSLFETLQIISNSPSIFTTLRSLDLSGIQGNTAIDSLVGTEFFWGQLCFLESLDLADNFLGKYTIENLQCFSNSPFISNLTNLNFSDNGISSLRGTDEFWIKLSSLKSLDLSRNPLLSDENIIQSLRCISYANKNLTNLNLTLCTISRLDGTTPFWMQLTSIEELKLTFNSDFRYLPADFYDLFQQNQRLSFLFYSALNSIPAEDDYESLYHDFTAPPKVPTSTLMISPPSRIMKKGRDEMMEFMKMSNDYGLKSTTVLVVGYPGSGKTSLSRVLLSSTPSNEDNNYNISRNTTIKLSQSDLNNIYYDNIPKPTHGIIFHSWIKPFSSTFRQLPSSPATLKTIFPNVIFNNNNNQLSSSSQHDVNLISSEEGSIKIMDFAGQFEYYANHELFFRPKVASIYILVVSLFQFESLRNYKDIEEEISHWISGLTSFGPFGSSIPYIHPENRYFLCISHCDLIEDKLTQRKIRNLSKQSKQIISQIEDYWSSLIDKISDSQLHHHHHRVFQIGKKSVNEFRELSQLIITESRDMNNTIPVPSLLNPILRIIAELSISQNLKIIPLSNLHDLIHQSPFVSPFLNQSTADNEIKDILIMIEEMGEIIIYNFGEQVQFVFIYPVQWLTEMVDHFIDLQLNIMSRQNHEISEDNDGDDDDNDNNNNNDGGGGDKSNNVTGSDDTRDNFPKFTALELYDIFRDYWNICHSMHITCDDSDVQSDLYKWNANFFILIMYFLQERNICIDLQPLSSISSSSNYNRKKRRFSFDFENTTYFFPTALPKLDDIWEIFTNDKLFNNNQKRNNSGSSNSNNNNSRRENENYRLILRRLDFSFIPFSFFSKLQIELVKLLRISNSPSVDDTDNASSSTTTTALADKIYIDGVYCSLFSILLYTETESSSSLSSLSSSSSSSSKKQRNISVMLYYDVKKRAIEIIIHSPIFLNESEDDLQKRLINLQHEHDLCFSYFKSNHSSVYLAKYGKEVEFLRSAEPLYNKILSIIFKLHDPFIFSILQLKAICNPNTITKEYNDLHCYISSHNCDSCILLSQPQLEIDDVYSYYSKQQLHILDNTPYNTAIELQIQRDKITNLEDKLKLSTMNGKLLEIRRIILCGDIPPEFLSLEHYNFYKGICILDFICDRILKDHLLVISLPYYRHLKRSLLLLYSSIWDSIIHSNAGEYAGSNDKTIENNNPFHDYPIENVSIFDFPLEQYYYKKQSYNNNNNNNNNNSSILRDIRKIMGTQPTRFIYSVIKEYSSQAAVTENLVSKLFEFELKSKLSVDNTTTASNTTNDLLYFLKYAIKNFHNFPPRKNYVENNDNNNREESEAWNILMIFNDTNIYGNTKYQNRIQREIGDADMTSLFSIFKSLKLEASISNCNTHTTTTTSNNNSNINSINFNNKSNNHNNHVSKIQKYAKTIHSKVEKLRVLRNECVHSRLCISTQTINNIKKDSLDLIRLMQKQHKMVVNNHNHNHNDNNDDIIGSDLVSIMNFNILQSSEVEIGKKLEDIKNMIVRLYSANLESPFIVDTLRSLLVEYENEMLNK